MKKGGKYRLKNYCLTRPLCLERIFYLVMLMFRGVSLQGTWDTPYNLTTTYITPYKIYIPYQVNKQNTLKSLAITHFLYLPERGLVKTAQNFSPSVAETKASTDPVLPPVYSPTLSPGDSSPLFNAFSSTNLAMRSL